MPHDTGFGDSAPQMPELRGGGGGGLGNGGGDGGGNGGRGGLGGGGGGSGGLGGGNGGWGGGDGQAGRTPSSCWCAIGTEPHSPLLFNDLHGPRRSASQQGCIILLALAKVHAQLQQVGQGAQRGRQSAAKLISVEQAEHTLGETNVSRQLEFKQGTRNN